MRIKLAHKHKCVKQCLVQHKSYRHFCYYLSNDLSIQHWNAFWEEGWVELNNPFEVGEIFKVWVVTDAKLSWIVSALHVIGA